MGGMEIMLARLLGMTPDEMRHKVEQAVNLMEHGAKAMQSSQADLAQIKADLAEIKSHLGITEVAENVRAIANSGSNSNGTRIEL